MISRIPFILLSVLTFYAQAQSRGRSDNDLLAENVFAITGIMFHDVINPPAAARYYAYSTLGAYAITSGSSSMLKNTTLAESNVFMQRKPGGLHITLSSLYCMLETARVLIPSGNALEQNQRDLVRYFSKAGVKKEVIDVSVQYAKTISAVVAEMASQDGYATLSSRSRYQPRTQDSTWYPTPPHYMSAVEPQWSTIKTFFLDSCAQFFVPLPIAYREAPESQFFKQMMEVYDISTRLTTEQRLIAAYWDCNPFASFNSGHVSIGIKKISPAGHWMSITGIACRNRGLSFQKSVEVHAAVALGMHDGFVRCWETKYRTDRVRPKTVINRVLDPEWNPMLETPPFPEYTSGHSVISTIAAELLTFFLGDGVMFVDNTEVIFGLPEREFQSFRAAAEEASISRLYGGIHFRDAIVNGQYMGKQISDEIIRRIGVLHY